MNDLELSEQAQIAMREHRYKDAKVILRTMKNFCISFKMELLVIQHELAYERQLEAEKTAHDS